MISFAVTEKLICVFVFAYAKIQSSHNEAHLPLHILEVCSIKSKATLLTLRVIAANVQQSENLGMLQYLYLQRL